MSTTITVEFSKTISDSKIFEKSEYIAKTVTEDFEAVVTVSKYKDEPTYVNQIKCTKGEKRLNHYSFWDEIQKETLKLHKQRLVNEHIMNTVDLDDWCDDGSDPEKKNKKTREIINANNLGG